MTNPSTAPKAGLIDVTVVLLDGGYASTAILPVEVFHSAGRLWNWLHGESEVPRFCVRVASLDGGSVGGVGGLGVIPAAALQDVAHTDIAIVGTCGWDLQQHIAESSPLLAWLRRQHASGAHVAGVCTGVAFLAEAGLLDGRQATTHWAIAETFRRRYPKVLWHPDQFVTEDGRVLCSGGVTAALDLSLYLVERFCGHEVALETARALLVDMPRLRQSGYAVVPLSRPHDDARIRAVEEFIQAHSAEPLAIEALARLAGMGPRNFLRRFKAATGRLPGAYLQKLRVAAARTLLEEGVLSVQEVCGRVGYEDLAFFRRLFRRETGMTPSDYRARFGRHRHDPAIAA